jgi:hypothetical protein
MFVPGPNRLSTGKADDDEKTNSAVAVITIVYCELYH